MECFTHKFLNGRAVSLVHWYSPRCLVKIKYIRSLCQEMIEMPLWLDVRYKTLKLSNHVKRLFTIGERNVRKLIVFDKSVDEIEQTWN